MSVRKLEYKVKILETSSFISKYHEAITCFFTSLNTKDFSFSFEIENFKTSFNEFDYDELQETAVIITCTDIKDSDFVKLASHIHKMWCKEAQKNPYIQWLIVTCCYVSSPSFVPYGNFRVNEISFGTLPRMKDFIQSYRFREVKVSSHVLSSVLCTFNHLKKEMTLYMSISHKHGCEALGEMGYKIILAYESILRVIANVGSDLTSAELFLHLDYPPFITTGKSDEIEETSEEGPVSLRRITKAKEMEYSSQKFERTFSIGCSCNKTLYNCRLMGRNLVLKLVIDDKFQLRYNLEQLSLRCSKKTEICFTYVKTHFLKNDDKVKLKKLPRYILSSKCLSELDQFNCEYAWSVVQCRSDFVVHQISLKNIEVHEYEKRVRQDIFSLIKSNLPAFVKALYSIADMIDKGTMFDFLSVLKKKHFYFCHYVEAIELPKGMTYVRRVLITPSRTIFLQPYEHFDNRIIRKFGTEYMMRASVQDDNYSKLTFAVQYNSNREEIMQNVVGKVLLNGITIGSRTYEPLAASTSQLRDHGIWLYAKDNNLNTAYDIRQWMGDFSSIKNVAKFMARMGQCFSSTETGVHVYLENENEVDLKEIRTRDKRFMFSDGIGIISSELAEEVRHALRQNIKGSHLPVTEAAEYNTVAFQIRYKGYKGVVVEYEGDKLGRPELCGRKLGVRPSMNKFECTTSNQLEIVKISSPTKLFLNKHLITILEQLGVPKEVFLNLELDMILHLLDSLIDENVASSILTQNLSPVFPFHNLQNAGICLTKDPFFRSLLLAYFKSYAENLTSKMRIAVPHEYGRNMLGVLDETKTLKYGQVFVQYSKSLTDPSAGTEILTGPVIVTKNPSLHPGDVRKLTAVNVPALHHIKDCIVFPARGPRPHPDEMAGSDLDGDEMVVCWYEPLIFSRKSVKPMIYPVYKEEQSDTDIQVSDMIKFFCHYIQNDNIGTFAHAHLVWADKLEEGVFSQKCMTIAKNYPYVLDFAKYGTTKYLKKGDRPSQYPDFMQKGLRGNTYHSHKVLGILYRISRVLEACSSKISLACETSSYDPDLEYSGWRLYEESAERHRKDYTEKVLHILGRYNLRNEAEAFSGCIELDSIREWRQERDNAIKVVKRYFSNIMGMYSNLFLQEVEEESRKNNLCKEEKLERMYQRASAWYMVVYGKKTEGVLSFAWVLSDILLEIKGNSMKNKSLSSFNLSSFFNDLDCDIKLWCDANVISCDSEKCQCSHLLEKISLEWIFKSGLNITKSEANTYCKICYERIFSLYKSKSDLSCCSGSNKKMCSCKENCSPAKLLVHFLKFFITTVQPSLGFCDDESCDGFLPKNLQELSLQTYSYLTVTRNIFYVGLQFNTNNCTKNAILARNFESVFEEEWDPIKIPVDSTLKEILENHLNEVKSYLMKKSGVRDITLKPVKDPMCLIVNSAGRNWQRWNLQEILLDANFTANLKKNLSIPS